MYKPNTIPEVLDNIAITKYLPSSKCSELLVNCPFIFCVNKYKNNICLVLLVNTSVYKTQIKLW